MSIYIRSSRSMRALFQRYSSFVKRLWLLAEYVSRFTSNGSSEIRLTLLPSAISHQLSALRIQW
jgi:hypothetical protein